MKDIDAENAAHRCTRAKPKGAIAGLNIKYLLKTKIKRPLINQEPFQF